MNLPESKTGKRFVEKMKNQNKIMDKVTIMTVEPNVVEDIVTLLKSNGIIFVEGRDVKGYTTFFVEGHQKGIPQMFEGVYAIFWNLELETQ